MFRMLEDRTHILPWLLRSDINLNLGKQTEYLDLGTNSFWTSIEWFVVMCHCDLTKIHAFEVHDQLLDFPEVEGNEESKNYAPDNDKALRVKERFGISQWMLKPMWFHYNCVADGDEYSSNWDHNILSAINITHFIKEGLKLTAADTVERRWTLKGEDGQYWRVGWRIHRWLKLLISSLWRFITTIVLPPCLNSSGTAYTWHSSTHMSRLPTSLLPCTPKTFLFMYGPNKRIIE